MTLSDLERRDATGLSSGVTSNSGAHTPPPLQKTPYGRHPGDVLGPSAKMFFPAAKGPLTLWAPALRGLRGCSYAPGPKSGMLTPVGERRVIRGSATPPGPESGHTDTNDPERPSSECYLEEGRFSK